MSDGARPAADDGREAWLDALRARFKASAAWITRREGGEIVVETSAGLSEALAPGTRWPLSAVFDRAPLETGRPAYVANAAKDPALRELAFFHDHGFQSYAGVPRSDGDEGTVAIMSEHPLALSAQDLLLLSLHSRALPGEDAAVLEPSSGALTRRFLLELADAELAAGRQTGLLVVRSTRLEEIRRDKGAAVADRLLSQLCVLLRAKTRPTAPVGRLSDDALGVLLVDVSLHDAQRAAERLAREVRESSRWPTAAGLAHGAGLTGGASALAGLGLEAAEESRATGARNVPTRLSTGSVPPPVEPPTAGPAADTALAARYQRLALLNRMSLELFGDKPFAAALTGACHTALALTGARAVAVYFADELGAPALAYRHGDSAFSEASARAEERALADEAFAERRLVSRDAAPRHWSAAPLLRITPQAATVAGAAVFGYDQAPSEDPERDRALVEIARILRNARLIQRTLQQQKVFAEVFEQSADALLITDQEARALKWNRSAEELFGWPREELVGRDSRALVPPDRKDESRKLEAELLASGRLLGFETARLRKDGSSVPVEITATALRDDDAVPFGLLIAYRDITKRKEVDRMKSEFMALVSHELRTPLTAIRGFAETIFDFWDEITVEQRRHYLRIILDEGERLSQLVTDFLDITRLEGGGIEWECKEVPIEPLFGKIAALFREHPSKAAIAVEVAPGAERLKADPEQLYRLLVNLVGNALKYSVPGGTVTLRAVPDGDAVTLSVADQGPGIAPADREKLFTKFFRAGDPVSRKTPGTGLGLAICKGIVDAHGGRIWAESEPGHGAVFKVRLPREGK